MTSQSKKNLQLILHPYVFVLKEGIEIKDNFLDYSLMILQVTSPETIKSPQRSLSPLPSLPIMQLDKGSLIPTFAKTN